MIKAARNFAWLLAVLIACVLGTAPTPARADRLNGRFDLNALLTPAMAQERQSLRDRILGRGSRREEVSVARFTSQGGPNFILDESGARPMMRFEGSDEIWVLRPSAGLRGDIYYRNDVGEMVLRMTRLGGITLYTASSPGGLPCAVAGAANRLSLPNHDIQLLLRHFMRESVRAGQAAGTDFEITARAVDPSASDVFGDAATLAVDGIVRMGQSRSGRERLSGLRSIIIASGSGPDARRNGETLMLTVAPRLGAAGRPSSARIMRALS
ncbi:MAG: DUF4908 domain-containing protein [Caulobacterales bacterium]|nr:DUF4908 domain-containing protein [Caulobacterales bacterium]